MKFLVIVLLFFYSVSYSQNNSWSLQKCIDYAIANNIDIQSSNLSIESSKSDNLLAKSKRLPDLNFSLNQRLNNGTSIDPITSEFISQNILSSSGNLNSQMTLYSGGQISNEIKQTQLLIEQNALVGNQSKNTITLSILEAYIQVLYNKESLTTANNNLEYTKRNLELLEKKNQLGSTIKREVLEMEVQVASKEYVLVQAQGEYKQQLTNLKQLLELAPFTEFDIENIIHLNNDSILTPTLEELYFKALNRLPEVQAATLGTEIQQTNLAMAKGGNLPSVYLNGGVATGYTSTQLLNFGEQLNSNFNSYLGLTINVPIFNRNQTNVLVQKAKIEMSNSELNLIATKKRIYTEVETIWQNSNTINSQEKAALKTLDVAKKSYDLAQKQFELGDLNVSEFVVYENTLLNAQQTHLQTKYLKILNGLLLDFYQGKELKI